MSNLAEKRPLTYADYLVAERASETKHEFADGEVFAMAGARRVHNSIAAHALASLVAQLRGRRCEAFGSDMRVRTGDGVATYPDVLALCGEPRFTDATDDELLNPSLLIEILSDGTEAYDRGEKFDHYRTIASLREYVLIASDRIAVDVFVRGDDGELRFHHYGAGDAIPLASIACTLAVDELYAKSGLLASTG